MVLSCRYVNRHIYIDNEVTQVVDYSQVRILLGQHQLGLEGISEFLEVRNGIFYEALKIHTGGGYDMLDWRKDVVDAL